MNKIALLSAVKGRSSEEEWSLFVFFTISVLIVNLKQQEIHCDPQRFTVHRHMHDTHKQSNYTYAATLALIILHQTLIKLSKSTSSKTASGQSGPNLPEARGHRGENERHNR